MAVFLLGLFILISSCQKQDEEAKKEPVLTLLFYMGGDNNLSSEVNGKIVQILSVPLSPLCRVLIYKDTRDGNPQLLELQMENETVKTTIIREYEETNSASAETLIGILNEVRERFPTPSYGLYLFSHASGWLPEGAYNNPDTRSIPMLRSVVIDGSSEMEIPALAAAIPDGMFEYIVFEACHMAGIEVAWELKNKTKYIVASAAEIVSPGFATAYGNALPKLYQNDLAGFCAVVENDYHTRQKDYTLSLIDTQRLEGLAVAIRTNFSYNYTSSNTVNIGNGGSIQSFDRYDKRLFFDFGAYYSVIPSQTGEIDIQTAINDCVVWKSASPAFMPEYGGFGIVSHSGLTTYIMQEQYLGLNEAYKELKWYKEVLAY